MHLNCKSKLSSIYFYSLGCFNIASGMGSRCPKGWYCSGIKSSCRKCAESYRIKMPKACIGYSTQGMLNYRDIKKVKAN